MHAQQPLTDWSSACLFAYLFILDFGIHGEILLNTCLGALQFMNLFENDLFLVEWHADNSACTLEFSGKMR